MTVRFHVLSSGSAGNACVVEAGDFGVLVDFGLSPRRLNPRMRRCRLSWDRIHAVLLTHEHSDHWQPATLSLLAKLRLPIYCHPDHVKALDRDTRAFAALSSLGLIRHYEPGAQLHLHANLQCTPIPVRHDAVMTCGFRFEGPHSIFGPHWAIGYAADLGCWQPELAQQFANVDVLAVEFNHDVPMQLSSGRHPLLIRRVLSDLGHLSNDQGAALFAEVLRMSEPGRVKHLVQLHLSQDCNSGELAADAGQQVLAEMGIDASIHTTDQERAGPSIVLGAATLEERRRPRVSRRVSAFMQPLLPFIE